MTHPKELTEQQEWVETVLALARQVEYLHRERDEARREVCELICERDKEPSTYKYFIAVQRDWDCWRMKR